jgi:hypothetical protein
MLQLREEQIDALRAAAAEDYVVAVSARLRQRYGEALAPLDPEALRQLVRDGITSAKRFGITGKRDVEEYLGFRVRHGDRFPEGLDWARAILSEEGQDGSEKMTRLDLHELWSRED